MLFREAILEGLGDGSITLAFRRWTRPTVRAGGSLRTSAGVLAIEAVDMIAESDITEEHARLAGAASREALMAELSKSRSGTLYRITFRLTGQDPRIALRDEEIDEAAFSALQARLASLDRGTPWTTRTLLLIHDNPGRPAAELATELGFEKLAAKRRIRALKELGLTESLDVGYRLSPRGKSFVNALARLLCTNE